jgi:hypothetical protein
MQQRFSEIAYNAAQSEMLLPEDKGYLEVEGMEKTYKITQEQLRKEVDVTTAQKVVSSRSTVTDIRDLSLIYPLLVRMLSITHGMEDIYYSVGERDISLLWIGGKDDYIAKFRSMKLFVLFDGYITSHYLLLLKRSTCISTTKMDWKCIA